MSYRTVSAGRSFVSQAYRSATSRHAGINEHGAIPIVEEENSSADSRNRADLVRSDRAALGYACVAGGTDEAAPVGTTSDELVCPPAGVSAASTVLRLPNRG